MATNYASIKLSNAFVEEVRLEADASHRSVGGQVEYWAKLGRAIENSPGFSIDKVKGAMEGRVRIDVIPISEERASFVAQLNAAFDAPDAITRAHYSAMGDAEGAVGTNGKGGVVRRQAPGSAGKSVGLASAKPVEVGQTEVTKGQGAGRRQAAGGSGRKD